MMELTDNAKAFVTPATILFAVGIYSFADDDGAVLASMNQTLTGIEQRLDRIDARIENLAANQVDIRERLARVETKLDIPQSADG